MLTHKIGNNTRRQKEHSKEPAGAGEAAQSVPRLLSKPEDLRSSPAPMGESTVGSACYPSTEWVETDRSLGIPKACGLKASSRPIKTVSQMTIWKAPKKTHLRSTSDLHTYIHRCAPPHTHTHKVWGNKALGVECSTKEMTGC